MPISDEQTMRFGMCRRPSHCAATIQTFYNAACTYGVLQNKAKALELFKQAIDAGYARANWAMRDPDLACLHGDPEFQRLCGAA